MSDPAQAFAAADGEIGGDSAFADTAAPQGVQPCPLAKRVTLRLVVKREDFSIFRDCQYTLTVGAERFEGSTGPSGVIDHLVAPSAKTASLSLWEQDVAIGTWSLDIAPIDPASLDTGAHDRLANLGLSADDAAGGQGAAGADELDYEIRHLQAWFGEEETGLLPDAQEILAAAFGKTSNEQRVAPGWTAGGDLAQQAEALRRDPFPGSTILPDES